MKAIAGEFPFLDLPLLLLCSQWPIECLQQNIGPTWDGVGIVFSTRNSINKLVFDTKCAMRISMTNGSNRVRQGGESGLMHIYDIQWEVRLSDIHHPNILHLRHSSPKFRHSSPQTFITPYLNSDIHHPDIQCPTGRVFQHRVGSGIGKNTG